MKTVADILALLDEFNLKYLSSPKTKDSEGVNAFYYENFCGFEYKQATIIPFIDIPRVIGNKEVLKLHWEMRGFMRILTILRIKGYSIHETYNFISDKP